MSAQATSVFQVALIKFKAKLVGSRYTHGEQKECKSQGQKKEHTGQALTRNCSFYSKGRKQATHIHRKEGQAHLSPVLTGMRWPFIVIVRNSSSRASDNMPLLSFIQDSDRNYAKCYKSDNRRLFTLQCPEVYCSCICHFAPKC